MSSKRAKKRIPIVATLVAFVAIVIMIGLGFWQLDRKAEKEQRLSNIEKASRSESIDFATALKKIDNYQDYVVLGTGKIINKYFYIDNKIVDGAVGFHVLVPFDTSEGLIMVNLGWVPSTGVRADLPDVPPVSFSSVTGIVYLPTNNSLIRETNTAYGQFPVLLQQLDLNEISMHLGEKVLPATLRLLPDDSGFVRQWQAVSMSPEKHLGYAIQWFGLAIAALTVYLLSLLKWMQAPLPTGNNEQ